MKIYKTNEEAKKEGKRELIDELIEQCYPYDDYNHDSVISEKRLKEIKANL